MAGSCTNIETPPIGEAAEPKNIVISVDNEGNFYWNGERVTGGQEEIFARLAKQASTPAASAAPSPQKRGKR
jgi:hypothetical protein